MIKITQRTLAISSAATALVISIPLGAVRALRRFWGQGPIVATVNPEASVAARRAAATGEPRTVTIAAWT